VNKAPVNKPPVNKPPVNNAPANKDPLLIMKQAGKTFYFASFWLSKRAREHVAVIYSFCRSVDDYADAYPLHPQRNHKLDSIYTALITSDHSCGELRPIFQLFDRYPSIREPLAALVRACREDDGQRVINSDEDLKHYSRGVAGNVGLIMFPLLGGSGRDGLSAASNLGIAMQLTNIARDVLSDLKVGRVYLPHNWLDGADLRAMTVAEAASDHKVISATVRVLELAECFYRSGLDGLYHIESRERFAIRVAAECYRAIGSCVIKNDQLTERATVPLLGKFAIVASLIFNLLRHQSSPLDRGKLRWERE
jgi:phytoene synthase